MQKPRQETMEWSTISNAALKYSGLRIAEKIQQQQ